MNEFEDKIQKGPKSRPAKSAPMSSDGHRTSPGPGNTLRQASPLIGRSCKPGPLIGQHLVIPTNISHESCTMHCSQK